jgi:hypothetical protein
MNKLCIAVLGLSLLVGCAPEPDGETAASLQSSGSTFTSNSNPCPKLNPADVQGLLKMELPLLKSHAGADCFFNPSGKPIPNVTVESGWTVPQYTRYAAAALAAGTAVPVPGLGDAAIYVPRKGSAPLAITDEILFVSGSGVIRIAVGLPGQVAEPKDNLVDLAKFILAHYL